MNPYLILFLLLIFFCIHYFFKDKIINFLFKQTLTSNESNKLNKSVESDCYENSNINDVDNINMIYAKPSNKTKLKTDLTDSEKALFDDISINSANSSDLTNLAKSTKSTKSSNSSINIDELSFGTKTLGTNDFDQTSTMSDISKISKISNISNISNKYEKSNDSDFDSIDNVGTFDNISNISNISQLSEGSLQSNASSNIII